MKKERGAITLITLATMLFMIAFLVSTITIIKNRRQAQAEIKQETKEIYEKDIDNIEQIYNDYFADVNVEIQIYTVEQLLEVGQYTNDNGIDGLIVAEYETNTSGETIYKIYRCKKDSTYILMNDLSISTVQWNTFYNSVTSEDFTGFFYFNEFTITDGDGIKHGSL